MIIIVQLIIRRLFLIVFLNENYQFKIINRNNHYISMISDYVFHSAFFLFIPDTARCHSWNSSTNQQHVNNIYTCITL